ncbi:MAG: hypothetical protein A2Y00_03700 [Omnitrophica WOR_2 bacterium GWF2_43_52]|nr:MAG: hypothetical protein A2062_00905 [Omnitrophica WOR_2 bacterium GWA2_44_7]OGX22537.1 MAG: hypothetical protein A2Y00_03700 [Omnitrophica WOR_2 bacterium GWF2_43_52]OGX55533.1 MAG: hypothetical protein A2460_04190 [Omnitrophica WOR_2 bacterium RIFOXYC2_FULL_43_9]HAH21458.1 hypothetical protein [Candidatus Omnitrophota bacterium]HBG64626.1 hypothetical protein [Candidatus Omnitrophota bacterium]
MQRIAEHIHPEEFSGINYRVARTREEIEQAYALVYKEYLKKGYTKKNNSGLRFSIYNALPLTTTFIAATNTNHIAATATVISDSPIGLPMDELYQKELSTFRGQGKKLCEISMLATDNTLLRHEPLASPLKKLLPLFILFKTLLDYTQDILKSDIMYITIHPKYKTAFNLLAFKDLSGVKSYQEVNGAPAIGQYVDFPTMAQELRKPGKEKLYAIFIINKTDHSKFENKLAFSLEDLRYFFSEKSDIFKTAPQAHKEYIERCYSTGEHSLSSLRELT